MHQMMIQTPFLKLVPDAWGENKIQILKLADYAPSSPRLPQPPRPTVLNSTQVEDNTNITFFTSKGFTLSENNLASK